MIFPISGGTKLFAAIDVIYPAGSTLTCSNGSKTLTATPASDADTEWVFAIPKPKTLPETWTVTATDKTDSTKTKSQSVSITTEGQWEIVELRYTLVLYDKGVVSSLAGSFAGNGGHADYGKGNYDVSGTTLSIDVESGYGASWALISTENAIDVTEFNTLRFSLTRLDTKNGRSLTVGLAKAFLNTGFIVSVQPNATGVVAIDVSGTSGLLYPAIYGRATYDNTWETRGAITAEVDRIELE